MQRVFAPAPVRFGDGAGTLALFGLVGFLMFGLGASIALFQHGENFPVFARQAPEDFDRGSLNQRQVERQVEVREQERVQHAAPAEEIPAVIPPVIVPAEETVVPVEEVPVDAEEPAAMPVIEPVEVPSAVSVPGMEEPVPAEIVPSDTGAVMPSAVEPPSIDIPEEPVMPEDAIPAEEVPAPVPLPALPAEIGVFFTQTSVKNDQYLLETLDRLQKIGGGALVFNVKAGKVFFHSAAPIADDLDLITPVYDLPEVIREAHERGITTIGRFVALKDPNLAQALPETQIRNPKTNRSVGSVWVDGSNPQVLTHNEQILRELAQAGIDEINLDYIRYPTEYAQASIGLTGNEKADHIEAFLKMARRVIDEEGGHTKLGISTYAILGWNFPVNFEPLGQDIARFAPLVDVISPMAYPATFAVGSYYNPARHPRSRMYYLVYRTLTGYAELLGDQAYKLRPWIQGYGITQKNLKDQIDAVFDSGSCGFTIWNASNEYGTFMKILGNIERPEHCAQ
jgi:hypothetical protein